MKNLSVKLFTLLSFCLLAFSSCELVEGIFKVGMWAGILIVVAIVAVVVFIFRSLTGKK
jgi:uncharacterized membrane protein YkvI